MQYKGWWEFPGGKIEEGETPQQALVREIKEELDTEIRVGELIDTIEYDYPTFHLSMDCFWAKIVAGNLELIEAAAAKWLTKETLDSEHSRFTFDELINEMIADAWYMVTEHHSALSESDVDMQQAQNALDSLNTELRVLQKKRSVQLKYGRLTTMIDI